ncbi:MAG: hypothetical protein KA334_01560, partial [Opitutaceae bacterium]|nr:hypothetical protein [Opitutaceae bacterium]
MSHPHDLPADEQLFDLLLEQAAPATASVPVQIPTPAPARDEAALSNFQQRLWLVQQMDPASTAYIMPFYLRLLGPLDRPALHRALQ